MIVSLCTTFNRPAALARSLPQIAALGWPCLVVDDGDTGPDWERVAKLCDAHEVDRLRLPENRGLACAMNVGLAYLLADPVVTHVSYFQDDIDLSPDCGAALQRFADAAQRNFPLITGHDAAEHPAIETMQALGQRVTLKTNCRATHLFAHRDYWLGVSPVPTRKLHAPCREPGQERGTGSNVDWWIVRNAPNSIVAKGGSVLCIPGLVRTFLNRKEDSTWDNEQRAGADAEFAR